jgi:hypothetical protein
MLANPATVHGRITIEHIEAERQAMPPEEFGRERMGWWDDPATMTNPVDLKKWDGLSDPSSQAQDPVALAISTAKDRTWSAISAAGKRADGRRHWTVIDYRAGTDWAVPRLAELVGKWNPCAYGLDPAGPEGSFLKAIEEADIKTTCACHGEQGVQLLTARDVTQACGAVYDAVVNDDARHLDQPHLNLSVAQAAVRPSGDGGAWAWSSRLSPVDISPLKAMTVADFLFAIHGHEPEYDVLDSVF